MSDNVAYTPGVGATVAADDIGGVLHQRIKVVLGADGTSDGDVSSANPLPVTGTVAVTGVATALRQDTGNTSVASIDTKTPALGQALAAASSPVVLTAAQVTTLTPPAAIVGFALEAGHLAAIDTSVAKIPAQGQALAAASMPVVLTAAQITTLTPLSSVTANAGTNLNTSALALEAGHLATIDTSTAKIPSQGQALSAASMPVVLPAAQITTLTPPAAITGFATETTLALAEAVLGAEDDEAVVAKYDEDATISARLRTISAQMEEFIDSQKVNQELLFRILMALTSDMPKTALEGN